MLTGFAFFERYCEVCLLACRINTLDVENLRRLKLLREQRQDVSKFTKFTIYQFTIFPKSPTAFHNEVGRCSNLTLYK